MWHKKHTYGRFVIRLGVFIK